MRKELDKKHYIELAEEGLPYEEIKQQAKASGVKGEALRLLMREVDNIILKKQEEGLTKSYAREWMLAGLCICIISMVMFKNAYLDTSSRSVYLILGCFVAGVLVFLAGRRQFGEF